jgi:broad specificity phosphatase PhoE
LIQRWRANPAAVVFEGGESLASLRERITRFIAEMAKAHDGATVLAATHDSPVRVAASLALGLEDSQHTQEHLQTPLASVTVLEVDGARLTLAVHKEAGHLKGIDGA